MNPVDHTRGKASLVRATLTSVLVESFPAFRRLNPDSVYDSYAPL